MKALDATYRYWGIFRSLFWLSLHPQLWYKGIGINGIPKIDNISRLEIGRNVTLNDKVYILCMGGVIIGDCVTLSHGCTILTSGLETANYPEICMVRGRLHKYKRVEIGNGVWLGARSIILPGVKIADKIIVGAGSVVTKNLEKEGWLYAGNPARPIKPLY